MRFLHTADWHLGRIFHGLRLTEEQSGLLEQLIRLAKEEKTEAVIIAGDIYDRSVPPEDAVRLFDEVLYRLVREAGQKVLLIAGNHDNPSRLGFGQTLLMKENVFITGPLSAATTPVILQDAFGPVYFAPLTYGDPLLGRNIFGQPETDRSAEDTASEKKESSANVIRTHEDVLRAQIRTMYEKIPRKVRSVAIAHAFLSDASASPDSERPLSIGGTSTVDPSLFRSFTYTALGHLHQNQRWGTTMAYAGSLMKYSFNEATQKKGVFIVDLGATGVQSLTDIPLTPRHELSCLSGSFTELTEKPQKAVQDHFLQITLTDPVPILDAKARLEKFYPHILHLQYARMKQQPADLIQAKRNHLGPVELAQAFFAQTGEQPLTAGQQKLLLDTIAELQKGDTL